MPASDLNIPWHVFGPLYHGTPHDIEGHITPQSSSSTYNTHMMGGFGSGHGVYVTTSPHTARIYAGPEGHVHEVTPHPEDHGPFDYELDPMSGPHGDNWNAPTLQDAAELASYGDEGGSGVSLKFPGRMISKRQFRE